MNSGGKKYTGYIMGALLLLCLPAFACVPTVNLGGFISFCRGNSITLNASNNNATYSWSTGATTPQITVTSSGTYWVTVTNVCGTAQDTVVIQVDDPLNVNLGPDRPICAAGDSLVAPYIPGASYSWTGGGTPGGNKLYVNQPGTYTVSITNACGTFGDQVNLSLQSPATADLGPDKFLCSQGPTQLLLPPGLGQYRWAEVGAPGNLAAGPNANSITVSTSGLYYVEVTNACGSVYDSIDVWYSQGPDLDLGGPVVLCGSGSANLTANANRGTYLWSTGATTQSVSISTTGTYWLRFTDACGVFYDTVNVIGGGPAVVNLGPDRDMCSNKPEVLDAGNPGSTYLWSNGATSQTITPTQGGPYWVAVDNGCGPQYDSINIIIREPPDPLIDDTIFYCQGGFVMLDAGIWGPSTTYLWSDNGTGRYNSYSTPGFYSVQVGNNCDTVTKRFHVIPVSPLTLDLGPDTVLCESEYTLDVGVDRGPNDVLWFNGANENIVKVSSSGTFWVQVTNACGIYTDTVKITFLPKPTGFSNLERTICSNSIGAKLRVPFDSSITYLWNTGSDSNAAIIGGPGTYWLYAYNQCDTIRDTIEIEYDNPISVDLGPDTILCEPGIAYYDVSALGADSVRWSTGSRNAGLPVQSSGTYWVNLYNACGIFSDTVVVTVLKKPVRRLVDTAICTGSSFTFDVTQPANIPATTYLWSTGPTTPTLTATLPGMYVVTMTNECGTTVDQATLRVDQPIPQIDLGNDTIFCEGTLLLNPGNFEGARYRWQDGSSDTAFLVTQSGKYYVNIVNACNSVSDTIHVLITGPPQLILGNETRFCFGSIFTLNAQNPGSSYLWSTGEITQTIDIDSAGLYWVTITNDCGSLTDSVNVIVEYNLDNVDLGPDTVICMGDVLRLQTQYPDVAHLWTGGSTDTILDVTTTGIYWVRLTNTCGSWVDSIFVEVVGVPFFSLGNDTVICAIGGSVQLSGPPGMLSYEWNGGNGPNTQNYLVSQGGIHYLTVANECFSYTDTIFIEEEFPINIDLGPDTALCQVNSVTLDPGITRYPVNWNDGTTRPTLTVTRSGWYVASARNSCGLFLDSVYVDIQPFLDPPRFDTTICREDSAVINLSALPYSFEWFDGSTDVIRTFYEADTFALFITNKCGTFQKDFVVQKVNCECPFFIPNAFTPNKDGKNETWQIQHSCPLTSFHLVVYNRWGIKVFESRDIEDPWDGTVNGKPLRQDVYTYQIEYHYEVYQRNQVRYENGKLTLLR